MSAVLQLVQPGTLPAPERAALLSNFVAHGQASMLKDAAACYTDHARREQLLRTWAGDVTEIAPQPDAPVPTFAGILAEVEKLRTRYQERTGYGGEAFEIGALRCMLQEQVDLRDWLLRELQTAVQDTCNAYEYSGHLARVSSCFGIKRAGEGT